MAAWSNHSNPSRTRQAGSSRLGQNQDWNIHSANCEIVPAASKGDPVISGHYEHLNTGHCEHSNQEN